MLIRSLYLENIRSYTQVEVSFSKGKTLLSGDIGSGKSTLLIALEFALFGVLRGKTSPAELLRHGEKKGRVVLSLDVDGKEIIVERGLKKSGQNIVQTSGSLSINGTREELMPTEIKARVLSLLGYPQSLIAKSTNLFRYTVYTPQEQVKAILHETAEERKDIIRKIFAIDNYRQVVENTHLYTTDVRERIQRLSGKTDDLKTLYEQQRAQKRELESLEKDIPQLQQQCDEYQKQTKLAQQALDAFAKEKEKALKEKQRLALLKKEYSYLKDSLAELKVRKEKFQSHIESFSAEKISFDSEKKSRFTKAFEALQHNKSVLAQRIGAIQSKLEQADQLTQQVATLTHCPTCQQNVSPQHKENITKEQLEKKKNLLRQLSQYKDKKFDVEKKEQNLQKKFNDYLALEKKHLLYQQQKKQIEQIKKDLLAITKQQEEKNEELTALGEKIVAQKTLVDSIKVPQDITQQEALKRARQKEQEAQKSLTQLQTRRDVAQQTLKTIAQGIAQKEKINEQITQLQHVRHWVGELFVPLVQTIEKRVLRKVYQEFNEYFKQWFDMLVDDDTLVVRLDEDFTPLVEQNGFDTSIANLSGGEKTSLALSYRLALNKVLNNFFGSLHTKEVLILDEPTDGFSSEQIDNLREVIDQIGVLQLIIVSHEQKLESLADHILRIEKVNGVSVLV